MSKAHAFLSASAAHRWIACPPSAKLQEKYEDKGSEYAAQGTDAHTLAEWKALKLIGVDQPDPRENLTWYDQEMEEATDAYAQYIAETIAEAKKTCSDPCVMIEQRVDFSRWVPDGFGTADAIVVGSGHLWITDLKFGTGVEVLAENNPQAGCYALGCIELLDDLYGIDTVTMQIFQPRRSHVSEWTVSKDELLKWAEEILRPAAKLAAAGKGKFCPGDHCRFCKARHECRARADAQLKLMRYDFELPPTLTDEEIEDILGQADHLIAWAEDIKAYALESAIGGKHWNGYKLVEGRSIRRYTDEEAVARAVQADGKDPYLYPSLLLLPVYNDTTNRTVFEGSYVGASSFAAWEDDTGQNRRMLEVRTKKYESSLDNAVMLRVADAGVWSNYRIFHAGMPTGVPIANGGTGATTAANARSNLGANNAGNLTTGTLAMARLPFKVAYGSGSVSGSSALSINYSSAGFTSVPCVVVSYSTSSGNWSGDNGALKIHSKTTTGATIIVGGNFNTSRNVDWIAIGT